MKKIIKIIFLCLIALLLLVLIYQFPYKKYMTLHYFYDDLAKLHVKKEDIEIEVMGKSINTTGGPYNIRFTVKNSPYLYYYYEYDFKYEKRGRFTVNTGNGVFFTDIVI